MTELLLRFTCLSLGIVELLKQTCIDEHEVALKRIEYNCLHCCPLLCHASSLPAPTGSYLSLHVTPPSSFIGDQPVGLLPAMNHTGICRQIFKALPAVSLAVFISEL